MREEIRERGRDVQKDGGGRRGKSREGGLNQREMKRYKAVSTATGTSMSQSG